MIENSNRILKQVWNNRGDYYLFEEHCYGVHRSVAIMKFEDDIRHRWWKINKGDVVIDCGAHYGSYTLPALAMGGIVHAFDVNDYIMKSLRNNIILNGFEKTCFLVQKALWDVSGYRISISDEHLSCLMEDGVDDKSRFFCDTISIDDYMKDKDRLDWIKIDVEGVEMKILEGAKNTIRKYRPRIMIEIHNIKGFDNPSRVKSFFDSNLEGFIIDGPYLDSGREDIYRMLYHPI